MLYSKFLWDYEMLDRNLNSYTVSHILSTSHVHIMSQDTCFCIEETWKIRFSRAFKKNTNFAFCFGGTFSFWRKILVWRNIREHCLSLAVPWPFFSLSFTCHALPCLSLPCLALPCLALPCPCLAYPCPCLVLPCLVLPCPCLVLPCLALISLALPCHALPWFPLRRLALPSLAVPYLAVSHLSLADLGLPFLALP